MMSKNVDVNIDLNNPNLLALEITKLIVSNTSKTKQFIHDFVGVYAYVCSVISILPIEPNTVTELLTKTVKKVDKNKLDKKLYFWRDIALPIGIAVLTYLAIYGLEELIK